MDEALLGTYRERARTTKADLKAWFGDMGVRLYIQVSTPWQAVDVMPGLVKAQDAQWLHATRLCVPWQIWAAARTNPFLLEALHLLSMLPKAAAAAMVIATSAVRAAQVFAQQQQLGTGAAAECKQALHAFAKSNSVQVQGSDAAAEKGSGARSTVIGAAAWGEGAGPDAGAHERLASVEQRLQQELLHKTMTGASSKRILSAADAGQQAAAAGGAMRSAGRQQLQRTPATDTSRGRITRAAPLSSVPDDFGPEEDLGNAGATAGLM